MSFLSSIDLTYTENGSLTYQSSDHPLVDLFFTSGALRNAEDERIQNIFARACGYDLQKAIRLLFFARDAREGQGERNFFRVCLRFLAYHKKYRHIINTDFIYWIAEYGRWDDALVLIKTPVKHELTKVLRVELLEKKNALCAKWMPREKSSKKKIAANIRRSLQLTQKQYRKMLAELTCVVETQMCANDWENIDFETVPGQAMLNYTNSFFQHDTDHFLNYLTKAQSGQAKINAQTIYPHQILERYNKKVWKENTNLVCDLVWNNLPNFLENIAENKILPVIDTSGSMWQGTPRCIDVSVALGMYLAERNVGDFQDHFITFSEAPQLQKIMGDNFSERIENLMQANWGCNTNLSAVFTLILERGRLNQVPQEEMPSTILILSDMEFDEACSNYTNFEFIQKKYRESNYDMPKLVFWNLMSRHDNCPVRSETDGTILMSGFSASTIGYLFGTEIETMQHTQNNQNTPNNPIAAMLRVVNAKRYEQIVIHTTNIET